MLLYILLRKYNPLNADWPVLLVLAIAVAYFLVKLIRNILKENEEKSNTINHNSSINISQFNEPELIPINYDLCEFGEIKLDTVIEETEANGTKHETTTISYFTFNYLNGEIFKSQNFNMDVETLKTHVWQKQVTLLVDSKNRKKYAFVILED